MTALFPFDINVWYGTPAQAAAVDDWADDNYDHSGLGFIGGTSFSRTPKCIPSRPPT